MLLTQADSPQGKTQPASNLPPPDDRPEADVVIYDGDCRLCTNLCHLLNQVDTGCRLAYLSLYDERVAERYPDLSQDDLLEHVYVIDRHGRRHQGAGAVRYLTRRLPALWPVMPVLHVPGSLPVWRLIYSVVSRYRRSFG